jgi:integrase
VKVAVRIESTVTLLRGYMEAHGLLTPEAAERPVFGGRHGRPMPRSGIRYLLAKHVRSARGDRTSIPSEVGPHTLRHSSCRSLHEAATWPLARDPAPQAVAEALSAAAALETMGIWPGRGIR